METKEMICQKKWLDLIIDPSIHPSIHPWSISSPKFTTLLLMEEIPSNHLGCVKPLKSWDKTTNLNWWVYRISSIKPYQTQCRLQCVPPQAYAWPRYQHASPDLAFRTQLSDVTNGYWKGPLNLNSFCIIPGLKTTIKIMVFTPISMIKILR